ncbi:MAG TPA: DUF1553 domain-containing protein [Pirellulaceae bacterium]|nr:DUF1553 domain-containing protein [Pirellulaceae bacterium]
MAFSRHFAGLLVTAVVFAAVEEAACAQEPVDFVRDVRPILVDHCYQCHGPDAAQRKAGLRLDLAEGATAELPSGKKAVVEGNPADSELRRRVSTTDGDERMPPAEGKPLTAAQQDILLRWIDGGAPWPAHWSLAPPQRAPLPQLPIQLRTWPRSAVDLFIARRLVDERLSPSPEAERLTLLRRVALDLTGIGPSPAEIERHLADASPDAYERAVDRLLASPRFGERMASDWLDAARYGDTHGYHSDSQRDMWRWRQWVIDALNANMPFDRFTTWQLGGDLLPNATLEQRIATGFNRNHMLNDEDGAIPEEYLCEYVSDRVTTTATVWLGLTVGCARCHDHKYDPLPQRDFYRLYAFFNNVPENGLGGRSGNAPPLVVAPTRLVQEELDQLAAVSARLIEGLARRQQDAAQDQAEWEAGALAAGALNRPPQDAAVHLPLDGVPQEPSGIVLKGKNPSFVGGKFGQALLGDGETCVELPRGVLRPGGEIDRSDPLTLSLWVFPTTSDRTALISSVDETLAGRGFELARVEERLVFRLTHTPERDELLLRTKEKLPVRKWRHVAVSYDGSGKAAGVGIFVDGQSQPLEVVHDTLWGHIATDQPLRIGRGDSETFFRGMLDEVQLFSRALSPAEVALLAGGNPIAELLRIPADERTAEQRAAVRQYYLENHDEAYRRLADDLTLARRREKELRQSAPTVMVMQEMPLPRDTFVLSRGRYDQPGEKVTAGTPQILPPLASDLPRNRLGLAQWLVNPDHPLTARVTVNRYWQSLFGTGLVKAADDFGVRGQMPSHPDLLDWLAVEFQGSGFRVQGSGQRGQETGNRGQDADNPQSAICNLQLAAWDTKRILRQMVTSATYRQSSRVTPELLARDPSNRLLARGPRLRLCAEAIRDGALAAAGLLDERIGGPSVRPYQPADLWKELAYNPLEYTAQTYVPSRGADLYRRSLYTFWKRTVPPPAMAIFDATDREVCTVGRGRTSTPLQALVLLNDATYVEAARQIAQRVMRDARDNEARLKRLFLLVLSRPPRPEEAAVLLAQWSAERQSFRSDPAAAKELLAVGQSAVDPALNAAELAAWTTLASVLLNLDEAVTNH